MANNIRCLMIGQAGIGKTTFLNKFPNSIKQQASDESLKYGLSKENYLIETFNSKFEKVTIDIENCDITLETCLHDTDLIVNNKVIPSNQFINTCNFKIIVLCFAMDDPNSFELVKSKWEIDLKRNKKKNHSFILLGLKSDTSTNQTENKSTVKTELLQDDQNTAKNTLKSRNSFKKRSSSINSNSSTSKLQLRQSDKKECCLHSEADFNHQIPVNVFKKFSKTIGSVNFIQNSSHDDHETTECQTTNKTKESLNSYEKLIKNILAKQNSCKNHQIAKLQTSNNEVNINSTKTNKQIIPKSLSAPINQIINRKSRKLIGNTELNTNENYIQHENSSFTNTNNIQDENNQTHLPVIKSTENSNTTTNIAKKASDFQNQLNQPISIKTKLSRLAIGLGTYIVTCGSAQSRKLAQMKHMRDQNSNDNKSRKLIKKNKSWLLLASEISLNTLDNDEVFAN